MGCDGPPNRAQVVPGLLGLRRGQDVAFAGGWTNVHTLEMIYQQPAPVSTYRAVSEPVKLREANG